MAALQQGRDQQKTAHLGGLESIEQGGLGPFALNVLRRRVQRQPAQQQHQQQPGTMVCSIQSLPKFPTSAPTRVEATIKANEPHRRTLP